MPPQYASKCLPRHLIRVWILTGSAPFLGPRVWAPDYNAKAPVRGIKLYPSSSFYREQWSRFGWLGEKSGFFTILVCSHSIFKLREKSQKWHKSEDPFHLALECITIGCVSEVRAPVYLFNTKIVLHPSTHCRAPKNWCFWTVCWRRLLRVPWTARRYNQSILKEISPGCSLEGLMLKLKLQYFGHLMRRVDSLEKTLMLGGIGGRRRRGR